MTMTKDSVQSVPGEQKTDEALMVQEFDARYGLMPSGEEDFWTASRRTAIKAFAEAGFPSRRTEAYKYTPVTKWLKNNLASSTEKSATSLADTFNDIDGYHYRTTDGQLLDRDAPKLPEGLSIGTLQEMRSSDSSFLETYLSRAVVLERDPFAALASAFADDGIFIRVEKGIHVDQPVVIHHNTLTVGGLAQPRMLIIVEEDASLNVVEHFPEVPAGSSFENRVAEVFIGEKAKMDHVLIFERNEHSSFVNGLFVHQGAESNFKTDTITLGGGLVRNNLNFLPDAEECETHLNGLYVARGSAHIDNHTLVDHAKPNCFSNELFKGIVTDSATGVFNGKVLVRQDAQKTNAYQSSKSIVLDRSAQIYAKPELEIYADDVKCSHGATTGELDEEALFYLRSRGIPEKAARLMLLEAFARDVVDLVDNEAVKQYLYERLHHLLSS